jgi:sugar-specific transcriptional regulator TrmB
MNPELLKRIGLTESQAKAYYALVQAGEMTPPELAKHINESRTTAYMALSKLESIGLAKKVETSKKQTYAPTSPSQLSKYIDAKRKEVSDIEEEYRAGLSDMLAYFYAKQRQPGLQYMQGEAALKDIYKDVVQTGEDVCLVRTYADEPFMGDELYDFLDARAAQGIKTDGLMPFDLRSYKFARKNDERLKRKTTWYPSDAYTAPVEISIYGNKVAIISFGDETIGTILESPQIAQAMRELYAMAKIGAVQLAKDRAIKNEI